MKSQSPRSYGEIQASARLQTRVTLKWSVLFSVATTAALASFTISPSLVLIVVMELGRD